VTEYSELEQELWHEAWMDHATAREQHRLAKKDLDKFMSGSPHASFNPLCELLRRTEGVQTACEVGCGAGYNFPVARTVLPTVAYTGIDISEAMIGIARKEYPEASWQTADAEMPMGENRFDCVILAGVLNHSPQPDLLLRSAIRASRKYILIHRLPSHASPEPEIVFTKRAYNHDLAERSFNPTELLKKIPGQLVTSPERWSDSGDHWQTSILILLDKTNEIREPLGPQPSPARQGTPEQPQDARTSVNPNPTGDDPRDDSGGCGDARPSNGHSGDDACGRGTD
jgi:SAM-dependent methyltransferase